MASSPPGSSIAYWDSMVSRSSSSVPSPTISDLDEFPAGLSFGILVSIMWYATMMFLLTDLMATLLIASRDLQEGTVIAFGVSLPFSLSSIPDESSTLHSQTDHFNHANSAHYTLLDVRAEPDESALAPCRMVSEFSLNFERSLLTSQAYTSLQHRNGLLGQLFLMAQDAQVPHDYPFVNQLCPPHRSPGIRFPLHPHSNDDLCRITPRRRARISQSRREDERGQEEAEGGEEASEKGGEREEGTA